MWAPPAGLPDRRPGPRPSAVRRDHQGGNSGANAATHGCSQPLQYGLLSVIRAVQVTEMIVDVSGPQRPEQIFQEQIADVRLLMCSASAAAGVETNRE